MTSNEQWVVPASMGDERRFAVLDISPKRVGDHGFWAALHGDADGGGLAAKLCDLLERDISGFVPSAVPLTEALADQKEHSLGVEGEWLIGRLESGRVDAHEVLEATNTDWCSGPRRLRQRRTARRLLNFRKDDGNQAPAAQEYTGEVSVQGRFRRPPGEIG